MLKKRERLTVAEFDSFFKSGKRFNGEYLQLVFTSSPLFHGSVVVGKKVHKKAVDRNKTRRRIYNALYQEKLINNKKGVFILLAKPTISKASYKQIKKEIVDLLARTT